MLLHEVAGWNASARLGGLEDEGVISRREGSDTYVRTYKSTGNRNPFHIISGLDGRPRGTRKELVSISTVAAPEKGARHPHGALCGPHARALHEGIS